MRKNKVQFLMALVMLSFSFWILGYINHRHPMPVHDYLWTWKDSIHLLPAYLLLFSASFLAMTIDRFHPGGHICKTDDGCEFGIFLAVTMLACGSAGIIVALLFFIGDHLIFYIFLCVTIGFYAGLIFTVLLNRVFDPEILRR